MRKNNNDTYERIGKRTRLLGMMLIISIGISLVGSHKLEISPRTSAVQTQTCTSFFSSCSRDGVGNPWGDVVATTTDDSKYMSLRTYDKGYAVYTMTSPDPAFDSTTYYRTFTMTLKAEFKEANGGDQIKIQYSTDDGANWNNPDPYWVWYYYGYNYENGVKDTYTFVGTVPKDKDIDQIRFYMYDPGSGASNVVIRIYYFELSYTNYINNQPCSIDISNLPLTAYTDRKFYPTVSCTDGEGHSIDSISYEWKRGTTIISTSEDLTDPGLFSEGDILTFKVTAVDEYGATAVSSKEILIVNKYPEITSGEVRGENSSSPMELHYSALDKDSGDGPISLNNVDWYVNGEFTERTVLPSLDSTWFAPGDSIGAKFTVSNVEPDGTLSVSPMYETGVFTVPNQAPCFDCFLFLDDNYQVESHFTVEDTICPLLIDLLDPDNEIGTENSICVKYTWYKNTPAPHEVIKTGVTGYYSEDQICLLEDTYGGFFNLDMCLIIPYELPNLLSREDVLIFTAQVMDNQGAKAEIRNATIAIENSVPEIFEGCVYLTPNLPRCGDYVYGEILSSCAQDVERDEIFFKYDWYVMYENSNTWERCFSGEGDYFRGFNTADPDQNGTYSALSHGDKILLYITPYDIYNDTKNYGTPILSDTITVDNTPPEILLCNFAQSHYFADEDISVEIHAQDVEGDFIIYSYRWMVDGYVVQDSPLSRLSSSYFVFQSCVEVEITASDGFSTTSQTNSTTIINKPPEVKDLAIIPVCDPLTDEFRASYHVEDIDGDPYVVKYTWNCGELYMETTEARLPYNSSFPVTTLGLTLFIYSEGISEPIQTESVFLDDIHGYFRDEIAPIIEVLAPRTDQSYGEIAPSFTFRVTEKYLQSVYYCIEGISENFTLGSGSGDSISTFSGTIGQQYWDKALNASIILKIHAIDTSGNEEVLTVVLERSDYYAESELEPSLIRAFQGTTWQWGSIYGVVFIAAGIIVKKRRV